MKQEDFERIKAICEKLEIECKIIEDGILITNKKGIWDGVEFVKVGKIHKVKTLQEDKIYLDSYDTETWVLKSKCTPSTEQAYVDQLKKEAHERFGEIKEGDRFLEPNGKKDFIEKNLNQWYYEKSEDMLFLQDLVIYCKGKWATRAKERVKVSFSGCYDEDYKSHLAFQSEFFVYNNRGFDPKTASIFLTSQLEKYLNGEV